MLRVIRRPIGSKVPPHQCRLQSKLGAKKDLEKRSSPSEEALVTVLSLYNRLKGGRRIPAVDEPARADEQTIEPNQK